MKSTADSLLVAAKKLADVSGLGWPHVQKFYRSLQQDQAWDGLEPVGPASWLPKSAGRKIWHAQPNFISRLIVALAAATDSEGAREAVEWTRSLTPMGRSLRLSEGDFAGVVNPLEAQFAALLSAPERADGLDHVEFIPESRTVIFRFIEGDDETWLPAVGEVLPERSALIRSRGVVDGELFAALARAVKWRGPNEAPLRSGDEEVDAE